MTEIHRTIAVLTDESYYYEVITGEDLSLLYIEEAALCAKISFASKSDMKAVALAMLELAERSSLDRAVLAEKE